MTTQSTLTLSLLQNEKWWGGRTTDGFQMPFKPGFTRDHSYLDGNQGMPMLLSNKGRYVWSDEPFSFTVTEDTLEATSLNDRGTFEQGDSFNSLAEVYKHVSSKHFPFVNKIPDPLFFTAPQYNLWIELLYAPTQEKVLKYASELLGRGFPSGVLIIDTLWTETYGTLQFHSGRFPNPKAMVEELHTKGFKVMLWVVPFITADTLTFRQLRNKNLLVTDARGEPALAQWWDGYSAILDLLNPDAVAWFYEQLDYLVTTYQIDGFKLDAGDPRLFSSLGLSNPHEYTMAWNKISLRYPLAEYKNSWRSAGLPVAQRICDRHHTWDEVNGVKSLIPLGLAQSLLGYPYVCPDLIGGGDYVAFPPSEENKKFIVYKVDHAQNLDQELFVRYTQCSALFPMMQFSAAPWRRLDKEHLQYCLEAAHLHVKFADYILNVAKRTAKTGEPMMRHMAYAYPDMNYEHINDQFLLGLEILVAPVVEKGATKRSIVFPPGMWQGDDGSIVEGSRTLEVAAPLSRLPWYRRIQPKGVSQL